MTTSASLNAADQAEIARIMAMSEADLREVERKLLALNAFAESERKRLEALASEFRRCRENATEKTDFER